MKSILIAFALVLKLYLISCEVVMLSSKNIPCQYIYHYSLLVNGDNRVNLICIDVNTKYQKVYQIESSGKVNFLFQYEDSRTTVATLSLRVIPQNKKSLDINKKIYYLTREFKHNIDGWKSDYTSGETSYAASIEQQANVKDILEEYNLTKLLNMGTDYNLCVPTSYTNCQVVSFYLQNKCIISIIKANVGSVTAYIYNRRNVDGSSPQPFYQELFKDPKIQEVTFCANLIMLTTVSSSKQYFLIEGEIIDNTQGQKFVKCVQLNSQEDTFALNVVGSTYFLAKYNSATKQIAFSQLGVYSNISRIPGYNSALFVSGTSTQLYCNSVLKPLLSAMQSPTQIQFLGEEMEDLQEFYPGYFLANFINHRRVIYEFILDEKACTITKFTMYNQMPRFTKPIFKDYDIYTPYQIYIINRMCADKDYFKTTLIDNEYPNGCYYNIGRQSKASDVFCNMQCRTCMPEDPNKCTSCFVEYEGYLDVSTNTCKCPQGYYIESGAPLKCKPCINGCEQCLDGQTCDQCSSTREKKNGACDCKAGQYFSVLKNDCQPLPTGCEQANYLGKCTQCAAGSFLQNDVCTAGCAQFLYKNKDCVPTCPKGTFTDITNKICAECSENCIDCSSATLCLACNNSSKLENNSCISKCQGNQYPDSSNTISCIPCHQACKTCIGPLSTNCSSCQDGFYRFK